MIVWKIIHPLKLKRYAKAVSCFFCYLINKPTYVSITVHSCVCRLANVNSDCTKDPPLICIIRRKKVHQLFNCMDIFHFWNGLAQSNHFISTFVRWKKLYKHIRNSYVWNFDFFFRRNVIEVRPRWEQINLKP